MSKVCPVLRVTVLYADCLDCDWKAECRNLKEKEGKEIEKTNKK